MLSKRKRWIPAATGMAVGVAGVTGSFHEYIISSTMGNSPIDSLRCVAEIAEYGNFPADTCPRKPVAVQAVKNWQIGRQVSTWAQFGEVGNILHGQRAHVEFVAVSHGGYHHFVGVVSLIMRLGFNSHAVDASIEEAIIVIAKLAR